MKRSGVDEVGLSDSAVGGESRVRVVAAAIIVTMGMAASIGEYDG